MAKSDRLSFLWFGLPPRMVVWICCSSNTASDPGPPWPLSVYNVSKLVRCFKLGRASTSKRPSSVLLEATCTLVISCNAFFGSQSLRQVGDITSISFATLLPKGGFEIIRGLQAGGAQFTTDFGLCRLSFYPEMLVEHSLQYLIDRIFAVTFLQLKQQTLHKLADLLCVCSILFQLETVHVLPGMPLQVSASELLK